MHLLQCGSGSLEEDDATVMRLSVHLGDENLVCIILSATCAYENLVE